MKVLLTGAMGSIGLSTLESLLEEGHEVVTFDLESRRARKLASRFDARINAVWGDITSPRSLSAALEGVDAVIHLAAIIPPHSDKSPDLARRVNFDATLDLIAQMEASPTAKRLVFASSIGIFGNVQDREPPLDIDAPVSPCDAYGHHKVASEQAIRQSALRWSILRVSAVSPIHLQTVDPSIMFESSPDARIEFLHPADAGMAFARAVASTDSIEKILHLGGGASCRMTYYEFTNALMGAIGIGPIPVDAYVRTTPPRFFGDWVDTEESQHLLQYQKRGLDDQLADMKHDFGMLLPFIRLVRPLATWFVTRSSAYLAENRRRRVS